MSEEPSEKPKLIIDDDWKERVQSEKEAAAAAAKTAGAAQEADSAPDPSGAADAGATAGAGAAAGAEEESAAPESSPAAAEPGDGQQHELPPASFATLVHSLTAQALASLGQIPDAEGKTGIELGLGKHFIDTLAVLEEKTKGNLDEEEAAGLAKMIYELRMLFVHVRKDQGGGDESPPA